MRRFEPQHESRRITVEELSERIRRDGYPVDPQKVADAVVERLLAGSPRASSMLVAAPRGG